MERDFALERFARQKQELQEEQGEGALQENRGEGKAIFARNVFNNCVFIFNFKGPEGEVGDERQGE